MGDSIHKGSRRSRAPSPLQQEHVVATTLDDFERCGAERQKPKTKEARRSEPPFCWYVLELVAVCADSNHGVSDAADEDQAAYADGCAIGGSHYLICTLCKGYCHAGRLAQSYKR